MFYSVENPISWPITHLNLQADSRRGGPAQFQLGHGSQQRPDQPHDNVVLTTKYISKTQLAHMKRFHKRFQASWH